jgi:murein DD-endopeptidase
MTTSPFALASPKPPRRRRGLFDFVLLLCLGYAVYARTPIGAVVETGIRVARGQKDHPSWLQTFRGRDTTTTSTAETTRALADLGDFARRGLPARLQAAATTHGVDVDTLAALVAVRGRCDDTACVATAPDRLAMYVPGSSGEVDVDVLARGLKAARAALAAADDELALEALFLGTPALELAIEQARRSGLEAAADVETHAPFLSPGARRGPLQGALAVLLVHRLRTLAWPADARFRITSPFGERVHPVTGKTSFHNGTDIGTPTGTPLLAAHHGTVKRQSVDSVSGNYLILDHGLGVQTTYCHLSATAVRERERIRRRQVVGEAGATGRVTGPHLHYILRIADKAVDPERYGEAPSADGALVAPPAPTTPPPTTTPTTTPTPKKATPSKKPAPAPPSTPAPPPAPPTETAPPEATSPPQDAVPPPSAPEPGPG